MARCTAAPAAAYCVQIKKTALRILHLNSASPLYIALLRLVQGQRVGSKPRQFRPRCGEAPVVSYIELSASPLMVAGLFNKIDGPEPLVSKNEIQRINFLHLDWRGR